MADLQRAASQDTASTANEAMVPPYRRRPAHSSFDEENWEQVQDARPILPNAAFFMGDLRDGLPMVRRAALLIMTVPFSLVSWLNASSCRLSQSSVEYASGVSDISKGLY